MTVEWKKKVFREEGEESEENNSPYENVIMKRVF